METNGYLFKVFSDLVLIFYKILTESNVINPVFDIKSQVVDTNSLNTSVVEMINGLIQEFLQVLENSICDKQLIDESDQVIKDSFVEEVIHSCEFMDVGVVRGFANGKVLVSNMNEEIKARIEKGLDDLKAVRFQNEEIKAKILDELRKVRNLNSEIKKILA